MGFGTKYQTAIRLIYASLSATVKLNGSCSSPFWICRGIPQGCPLSPLLFALALEPLVEALQNETRFKGISELKKQFKLSLFADDMVIYVTDPTTFLEAIEHILDSFYAVSGLRMKSCFGAPAYWIRIKYSKHLVSNEWKYLGVRISHHFSRLSKLNLDDLNDSIKQILRSWNNKILSWIERIT